MTLNDLKKVIKNILPKRFLNILKCIRDSKANSDFHCVPDIYGKSWKKMHDIREDNTFFALAQKVVNSPDKRTLLYYDRLYNLYQAFLGVLNHYKNSSNILNIAEIGIYRGGGAIFSPV